MNDIKNINWDLILNALNQSIADIKLNIEVCKRSNLLKYNIERLEVLLKQHKEEYKKIWNLKINGSVLNEKV